MRKLKLRWYEHGAVVGALMIAVSILACPGDDGSGNFPEPLPDGVVTSNTKADPSCGTCVQRKICVKPDVGVGNPCSSGWLPDQVKGCTKDAHWPNCRR